MILYYDSINDINVYKTDNTMMCEQPLQMYKLVFECKNHTIHHNPVTSWFPHKYNYFLLRSQDPPVYSFEANPSHEGGGWIQKPSR